MLCEEKSITEKEQIGPLTLQKCDYSNLVQQLSDVGTISRNYQSA